MTETVNSDQGLFDLSIKYNCGIPNTNIGTCENVEEPQEIQLTSGQTVKMRKDLSMPSVVIYDFDEEN